MTSKILLLLSLIACKEHVLAIRKPNEVIASEQNILVDISNDSCATFNLYKNLFEEMNSPNHPRIQVYYNRMVQKLYDVLPPNVLFQQLWQIYKKCDPSTFVAMVRAQLSLFWLHNMHEYPDYDYLLMVANGFYRIKNYVLYPSLNKRTQLLFQRALKSLPNSLHHLFGHRKFCLMNRKHEEILYQTKSDEFARNQDMRFAFTWHFNNAYYEGNNEVTPIFEDFNVNEDMEEEQQQQQQQQLQQMPFIIEDLGSVPWQLNIALFSKHFNNFYSRWPAYNHKIGGNKTELFENFWQKDFNVWTVQLVEDDHLVFSQRYFIMCATLFYDNKRRFVFGLKNRTALDTDCQWSASKCNSS